MADEDDIEETPQDATPVVRELCAVSQLPEAQLGEFTPDSLFYASVPGEDPAYESRKIPYSVVLQALSSGMDMSAVHGKLDQLSGTVDEAGQWLCCDFEQPYVISSILEDHGRIISVCGYRLSGFVRNSLCAAGAFHYVARAGVEDPEPLGTLYYGETPLCELCGRSVQPQVRLMVWPGAWKV